MSERPTSWGRQPVVSPDRVIDLDRDRIQDGLFSGSPVLAFGNGRSYGDVCLNEGGTLIRTQQRNRILGFDADQGLLDVEAGVLLSHIIERCLPLGWALAVTPGTAFVTVGGAIANDVHGKNHHRVGSFGHHVECLELLRSEGGVTRCSPVSAPDLFRATIGGLGLTGLILSARLRLRRVAGGWLRGSSQRFHGLSEFFSLSAAADEHSEYTVAWLDCLAAGPRQGRGVFMQANHAPDTAPLPGRRNFRVPITPPFCPINRLVLKVFNWLYFHRPAAEQSDARWDYPSFFHPLDSILEWNRLYGPAGFYQFQCVVPPAVSEPALRQMLGLIERSGQGSFLAVLKIFGDRPSLGMMSFPRPGATLALDFPNRGGVTERLMRQLEAITREAGGAIYPAKDAWLSPAAFGQFFPNLGAFLPHVDPAFSSSFWRRVRAEAPTR